MFITKQERTAESGAFQSRGGEAAPTSSIRCCPTTPTQISDVAEIEDHNSDAGLVVFLDLLVFAAVTLANWSRLSRQPGSTPRPGAGATQALQHGAL